MLANTRHKSLTEKNNKQMSGGNNLPMRDFAHSLPMALLQARESAMRRFRPMLRKHGLTEQQWRVIRALAESDNIEVSELADRCMLLAPSLTRILQFLESGNLVKRTRVAADQRRSTIALTRKGRQLFEEVAPDSEALYEQIEQAFGKDGLDQLYDQLHRMYVALETTET